MEVRVKYAIVSILLLISFGFALHNKTEPEDGFVVNKVAEQKEKESEERYDWLNGQFSQKGYHLRLTKYVAENIGNRIIVDHIYTHWLDQLNHITVRSCYKVEDRKGNVSTLTVQANISNSTKILKYEVIQ